MKRPFAAKRDVPYSASTFGTRLLHFPVFAFRVRHGFGLQLFRGAIQVDEQPPGGKKQGCRSNQPGRIPKLRWILVQRFKSCHEAFDGKRDDDNH